MTKDCVNPYCLDPKSGTRLPSLKEINRLRNELSSQPFQDELGKKLLNMLNKKQITIEICTVCNTWIAETWHTQQDRMTRQFIANPYKFNVGDRVKVTLEGEHYGVVGIIARRARLSKTIMPPPPPENIYYLVFEGNSQEHGYSEANLTPSGKSSKNSTTT